MSRSLFFLLALALPAATGCDLVDESCPMGTWRPRAMEDCVPLPVRDGGTDAAAMDAGEPDAGAPGDAASADGAGPDGSTEDAAADGAAAEDAALDATAADAAPGP